MPRRLYWPTVLIRGYKLIIATVLFGAMLIGWVESFMEGPLVTAVQLAGLVVLIYCMIYLFKKYQPRWAEKARLEGRDHQKYKAEQLYNNLSTSDVPVLFALYLRPFRWDGALLDRKIIEEMAAVFKAETGYEDAGKTAIDMLPEVTDFFENVLYTERQKSGLRTFTQYTPDVVRMARKACELENILTNNMIQRGGALIGLGALPVSRSLSLRLEAPEEEWRQKFETLVNRARLIFCVPAETEGIRWELEYIARDAALLCKTAFIIPAEKIYETEALTVLRDLGLASLTRCPRKRSEMSLLMQNADGSTASYSLDDIGIICDRLIGELSPAHSPVLCPLCNRRYKAAKLKKHIEKSHIELFEDQGLYY